LSALLAEAALRGGLILLRGNVAMLGDQSRTGAYTDRADRLEARGRAAANAAFLLATGAAEAAVRVDD
jgi:hypothetical protein